MEKILEIKNTDWAKGFSLQTGFPIGGIWQRAKGFNPYNLYGYLKPSLAATELTAPATNPIKNIVSYQSGGVSYILGQSNTKLYQYLKESPYTQVDLTSKITAGTVKGSIYYKGRYIYATEDAGVGTVRSSDLSASDVEILAGVNISGTDRPMCIGSDLAVYVGNGNSLDKATVFTTTAGNVEDVFYVSSDTSFKVRDIANDGRYLAIMVDDNVANPLSRVTGEFKCKILFWDPAQAKATADVIWDVFGESYIVGGKYVNGILYFFGANGLYACNLTTPPTLLFDQTGNTTITNKPKNSFQIAATRNLIYWADGAANGQQIFAYGKMAGIDKKIIYSPYISHNSTYAHLAITVSDSALVASVDTTKIYLHNVGSTESDATLKSALFQFDKPYTYSHAIVTLKTPLTSGQSITFSVADGNERVISDTVTKSYSASNSRKNLKFDLTPVAGSTAKFSDLSFQITSVFGAIVERVAIYATANNDNTQDL